MQIPWLVLPMRYETIVPQHAINRLLTTNLDVNFLWMQTKCDASLDFSFLMQMLFIRMQMRNVHMMQVSHAGVQMQNLSMMVPTHIFKPWCKCLLVSMPRCKCFDANTIYSKIPFIFKSRPSQCLKTKTHFFFLDTIYSSQKVIFLFLRFPKIGDHC